MTDRLITDGADASLIRRAEYIYLEGGESLPLFRRAFEIKSGAKRATLAVSALGTFAVWVNGTRLKDFILAPGWTEYEKRIPYISYDITNLLRLGENEIVIGVGSGWYGSNVGFSKYPLGDTPALICGMEIEYKDKKERFSTPDGWQAAASATLSSTIYGGEITDARIVPSFGKASVLSGRDKSLLYPFDGTPVREMGTIPVKALIITPEGDTVLDFGQNLTGYPTFKIKGTAGAEIKLECAEILDKNGNFYNGNYRSAKSLVSYVMKDGINEYTPLYTFFGFRYLRVSGLDKVDPSCFKAVVVHSDIRRTGYFKCGHAKLNKLYENIIWGQKGNFLDVPTDCPQRDERLGWTGDAQVFCRTANLNFDCKRFFEKWLRDLALAQYPDGGVPRVIPNVTNEDPNGSVEKMERRHSAAWGDAATVCPYECYVSYGDTDFLRECFPSMKAWVDYIGRYSVDHVWKIGFHYGDWLALDAKGPLDCKGGTDPSLIATAFYYHSAKILLKAADMLDEDLYDYEELPEKIKTAFNKNFVKDGKLTSDTQTAHVLVLHFGLVDGELREAVAKRLIELIEERGDTLSTGFVGTPYLLDTLTEIGRTDKAYTLLLQEKYPSWLYSVNMGATTVWEHWDGINEKGEVWSEKMNSFNHYAYGSCAAWLYRTVCGIRYVEAFPAYESFILCPTVDARLGFAAAKIDTPHGEIRSEWYVVGDTVRYTFSVPKGTSATLMLDGKLELLTEGEHTRYTKL